MAPALRDLGIHIEKSRTESQRQITIDELPSGASASSITRDGRREHDGHDDDDAYELDPIMEEDAELDPIMKEDALLDDVADELELAIDDADVRDRA